MRRVISEMLLQEELYHWVYTFTSSTSAELYKNIVPLFSSQVADLSVKMSGRVGIVSEIVSEQSI